MYCRYCGHELDDGEAVCTVCGSSAGDPPRGPSRDGRKRSLAIFIVLVLAIASVGAYAVVQSGGEPSYTVDNVTVYGDLVEVTSVEDGSLVYRGEGDVTWYSKDVYGTFLIRTAAGTYEERGYTATGAASLPLDDPGEYGIELFVDGMPCSSGRVLIDGDITKSYSWQCTLNSVVYRFDMDYTYSFSDFKRCADMDVPRMATLDGNNSRMVLVDDSILSLADSLKEEYLSVVGSGAPVGGQDYADYIASFVQCEIEYPDPVTSIGGSYVLDKDDGNGDVFMFDDADHWMFPIETIHHGMGDCEDTSFLMSALFSASGYTSALSVLPGHMVSAVVLDTFSERSVKGDVTISNKRIVDDGRVLYFCESTMDSFLPVGYLTSSVADMVSDVSKVSLVGPYDGAVS